MSSICLAEVVKFLCATKSSHGCRRSTHRWDLSWAGARLRCACGYHGCNGEDHAIPKYLIAASYSADVLKGLQKDKASGRQQAVRAALERLGGNLEATYFALGEDDVYIIVDLPDNVTATALGINVSATGLVRTRTTALLTVEEVDSALEKSVEYRSPGG